LIATGGTNGPAVAIAKGLDATRPSTESGNQVSVFNRMRRAAVYLSGNEEAVYSIRASGERYAVTDTPPVRRPTTGAGGG